MLIASATLFSAFWWTSLLLGIIAFSGSRADLFRKSLFLGVASFASVSQRLNTKSFPDFPGIASVLFGALIVALILSGVRRALRHIHISMPPEGILYDAAGLSLGTIIGCVIALSLNPFVYLT